MNSRVKTLLITVAWIGFTLLWINHGRHPIDRVLASTGAKEEILRMCSKTADCEAVRFERSSSPLFPLQSVHCMVVVRGGRTAVSLVEKILNARITGTERTLFTVTGNSNGLQSKGGSA